MFCEYKGLIWATTSNLEAMMQIYIEHYYSESGYKC